ncbi:MAG: response regulator [Limisphaerales bacterium]
MSGKSDLTASERSKGQIGSILFVEDDAEDFLFASRELRKINVANPICHVFDTDEMIAYLGSAGKFADRAKYPLPGLIIIDLRLPGRNGLAAQAYVRARLKLRDIPIIAISSSEQLNALRSAVSLGANSFMVKPFDRVEFGRVVRDNKLPVQFESS